MILEFTRDPYNPVHNAPRSIGDTSRASGMTKTLVVQKFSSNKIVLPSAPVELQSTKKHHNPVKIHVMTYRHIMTCQHPMTCHRPMTCHPAMTCRHAMTCQRVMSWHHVMICRHLVSCGKVKQMSRPQSRRSDRPGNFR